VLIDFASIDEVAIPRLNGGDGTVSARMHVGPEGKVMISSIPAGSSIGEHRHVSSSETLYVLSGRGHAICNGMREDLSPGVCHRCPAGQSHSVVSDGPGDLVIFDVVYEHQV
jgi:mannose-6-phosphate isomerase-like protein (cupin superfamily)